MIYTFKHPTKNKYIQISQSVNDIHTFFDENGIQWERIYDSPSLSIKTKIDPFSENDFLKATKEKRGSVGDMMDLSTELSEKRKERTGSDPIQNSFFKEYSKKRKGTKHPKDPKRLNKINSLGASVKYN
jgi:hypothetical protein